MDWLKCNICFCTYNDSNIRPRVLSCGHSFCERCLINTIQNENLTCPQCRMKHNINSVADIPINFVLEGLLKSLNPDSKDFEKGAIPIGEQYDPKYKTEGNGVLNAIVKQDKENSLQKDNLKGSAGMCIEHPNTELIFRCSSHKSWVCEKCIEKMGDHPKGYCNITSFKEEIEERRKGQQHFLENKVRLCNNNLVLIKKHISDLSDKRTLHISLVDSLKDLMNMHKNEEKSLHNETMFFENIIENGNNVNQRLLDVKGSVQNAATLDESNAARDFIENISKETSKWIKTSEKEVEEGNAKLKRSTQIAMSTRISLDFKDNNRMLLQNLEINCYSEQNQQLEDEINEKNNCLMKNNKSRFPTALNDDVCDIHKEIISFWCSECQIWICKDCLEFHSNLIGCSITPSAEAVESMKEKQSKSTDVVLTTFDKNAKYMTFMIQEHIDIKKELLERVEEQKKELLEKATEHDKEVKRLSTLLQLGNLHKKKLVECQEILNLENRPFTVCNQIKVVSHVKQLLRTWNFKSLEADALIELLMALKKHEYIFVKLIIQNEEMFAKVLKHEENIFIGPFQTRENAKLEIEADEDIEEDKDQEEDAEGLDDENDNDEEVDKENHDEEDYIGKSAVVEIDSLQKIVPKEVSLVFLQFSIQDLPYISLKSVQIRLTTNLPHVKENLLQIFTGEKGEHLKDVEFYWDDDCIYFGAIHCFEENKIAPTFGETNEAKSGDVIANYEDGYLTHLYLVVIPYTFECKSLVVGKIVKGFDTIKKLHKHEADDLKIHDCGLVIERKCNNL